MCFDYFVAQAWAIRYEDFEFLLLLLLVFVQQLVVRVQTRLTLRLTRLRSHAHPFQLTLERLAALAGHFLFLLHAFALLFEP